jgi:hypothetical protein
VTSIKDLTFILGSVVFILSLFYTGWENHAVTVPLCIAQSPLCNAQVFKTVGFTLVEIFAYLGFSIFLQYGTGTGKNFKK